MSETPVVLDPIQRRRKIRPGEQKDRIIAFRSSEAQKVKIDELAARRELSRTDMIRVLLRLGLKAYEAGER